MLFLVFVWDFDQSERPRALTRYVQPQFGLKPSHTRGPHTKAGDLSLNTQLNLRAQVNADLPY